MQKQRKKSVIKMDSSKIINEEMTLEEKLAAIDEAMKNAQAVAKDQDTEAPVDPATLVMCEGCQ